MTGYHPEPLDTSHIRLDSELDDLIEKLARSIHDNWARSRLDEGWRYGPSRNDERKEHPCLVPYEQLPESEKDYDRKTVTESLKGIVALGYELKKRYS